MLSELLPWWNTGFLTCIDAEKFGARIPKLAINEFPISRSETSGLEASPKEELINVVRSSESESELIENVSDGIRCILHTVKKGDTLWNIAQRYPGVTPEELAEINGISDYIRIGQTLCVPDPR
jgi:LysM repeat protein